MGVVVNCFGATSYDAAAIVYVFRYVIFMYIVIVTLVIKQKRSNLVVFFLTSEVHKY